jgi:NAD(P)-dependent dehydrogenase (short-subunit alcohol dehydrogenase family)
MSIWFITGASRGLGAEVTRAALARGHQVAATARDAAQVRAAFPGAGDALLAVPLDVTDPARIDAAVRAATDRFGGIDVLVNNAERGLPGAVEEAADAEIRSICDVSVLAMLAVTRAVLPVMRAARDATIVNLSPIGGYAVEGFTGAPHDKAAPPGITADLVGPGYFSNDYPSGPSAAMRSAAPALNHAQPGDPVKGAQAIVDAVDAGAIPVRLFLRSDTIARVTQKTAAFPEGPLPPGPTSRPKRARSAALAAAAWSSRAKGPDQRALGPSCLPARPAPRAPAPPLAGMPATGPRPGDRYTRIGLTPEPASAARARRLTRDTLTHWNMRALADDAELIVAELTANAITAAIPTHGTHPAISLTIHDRPGQLTIIVWDNGPGHPRLASATDDDEAGRGLNIIEALTGRQWGWWPTPEPGGKVAWATMTIEDTRLAERHQSR